MIGRWKMLDNLRRSLFAPGALFALIASWAIPNAPQAIVIGLVLTALAFPAILAITSGFTSPSRYLAWPPICARGRECAIGGAIGNSLTALTLLAQHALLMMDAILSNPGAAVHYPAPIADVGSPLCRQRKQQAGRLRTSSGPWAVVYGHH